MSKKSLSENVLSDNYREWLYRLRKNSLVGRYANDSIRNYLMEVRLLFQFNYDKNAIDTYKKPHHPINHKPQSVLKSSKSKNHLTKKRFCPFRVSL
jgi:hypothetical protein